MTEQELREQICLIGQLMHQRGYIDGKSGNISARLSSGHILATPSGAAKGFLHPDQLVVVDLHGQRVDERAAAEPGSRPTSELAMHLECYRQREDIGGVVHAHPPTTVALTLTGYDFGLCILPEAVVILGLVPTVPYAAPGSNENVQAIASLIREHDTLVLERHGSLTAASTVWDAYLRLETLEHTARILSLAEQRGNVAPLPADSVDRLLELRQRLNLARPGDEERFRRAKGG